MINLNDIDIVGSYQARVEINSDDVDKYAEQMLLGEVFPPIVIFNVDGKNLLADGYHRFYAHKKNNKTRIDADVRKGSYRDYMFYCWFTNPNNKHGRPPTNADKLKILRDCLEDFEVSLWTDAEIARKLGFAHTFVHKYRENKPTEIVVTKKDGTTYKRKATTARPVKEAEPEIELPPVEDKNAEVIEYLNQEVETLRDQLAVASVPEEGRDLAKETIESLREEIRLLQIDNASLKASRDKYQAENAQMKRQISMLNKKIKSLE